jgi:hypothetical protein
MSIWWRRICMMSNIGSLPTGQISTHAPQAVHAHTADSLMAKSIRVNSDSLPPARSARFWLMK